jgi:hypothetical protein
MMSDPLSLSLTAGTPSEKNLYADIDAAWQSLRSRYGISPEHVIIYGQSIGTGKWMLQFGCMTVNDR